MASDSVRGLAGGAVVFATLCCNTPAYAQVRQFDVPSEDAGKSIPEFARQAQIQLIAPGAQLHGVVTPPIIGAYDVFAALDLMLKGTGLKATSSAAGIVTISLLEPKKSEEREEMSAKNSTSILALFAGMLAGNSANAQVPSGAAAPEVEQVVVTGTLIRSNGYSQPSPVTVLPAEQAVATTPSGVTDSLLKLPQFAGSQSRATAGSDNSVAGGDYLNLNNMGVGRTLVLMDGYRLPATNSTNTVDTNTIPQMFISHVDVVTGGASAVYGSDAIAGVVNFIVDNKYNGAKGFLQAGTSDHNDAGSLKTGIAFGTNILDRGHIEASYEFSTNGGLLAQMRPQGRIVYAAAGTGTAANPYKVVPYARLGTYTMGGYVTSGPFAGMQFTNVGENSTGILTPFVHGTPTATSTLESGGDGSHFNLTTLGGLSTQNAFGRFDYAITDNINAFVQYSYARTVSNSTNNPETQQFTIYGNNAFLSPAQQAAIGVNGSFSMNRNEYDMYQPQWGRQITTTNNFMAGLDGTIFDNFVWRLHYTYGSGHFAQYLKDNVDQVKFYAAVDAVTSPATGQPVCYVSTTQYASLYPGCVPVDIFGKGNESQAALDYFTKNTYWFNNNIMQDVKGDLAGDLFQGWAGPVSAAFDAEYRRSSLFITSTANPLAGSVFTGQRPNIGYTAGAALYGNNTVQPQPYAFAVSDWEMAAEVDVPLLKNVTLAQDLSFNGAFRYTDYSSSGPVNTWKLGLNWQPIDDVRIRGTRTTDILAPNLTQLDASPSYGNGPVTDPHTGGGTYLLPSLTTSNPNLVPEVAHTWTLGIVVSPSWLPDFGLSADYYSTRISNGLSSIAGSNAATLAQCEASGGTSPLCALIVRPFPFSNRTPANAPTQTITEALNVASTYTKGIDFETSYKFSLEDATTDLPVKLPGDVDLRLLYNWQPYFLTTSYAGATPIQQAGVAGESSDRATLFAGWSWNSISVQMQERYLSGAKFSGNPLQIWANPNHIPAKAYTDLTIGYDFLEWDTLWHAYVSGNNIFDTQPPIVVGTGSAKTAGGKYTANGYDVIGRYVTFGVKVQMQ